MIRTITLATQFPAFLNGRHLKDYTGTIQIGDDNKPTLVLHQPINGKLVATPGQWYISTLNNSPRLGDEIFIDFGQGWYVKGMIEGMKEVNEILKREGF